MPKSQPADQKNSRKNDGGGAEGRRQVMRYAGLSTQVAVSVAVAVWVGVKADKALKLSFPIFSMVVPLLVIVFVLVQIVKANSGKKDEK
jgi:hypothetical protein